MQGGCLCVCVNACLYVCLGVSVRVCTYRGSEWSPQDSLRPEASWWDPHPLPLPLPTLPSLPKRGVCPALTTPGPSFSPSPAVIDINAALISHHSLKFTKWFIRLL